MRLIVVDDESLIRMDLVDMLEAAGQWGRGYCIG